MLCPCGQNKYLGIAIVLQVIVSGDERPEVEEDADELMLTFEEALTTESMSNTPSTHPPSCRTDLSAPLLPQGPGIRPDNYLLFQGQWIHKQTICYLNTNKDFISKSIIDWSASVQATSKSIRGSTCQWARLPTKTCSSLVIFSLPLFIQVLQFLSPFFVQLSDYSTPSLVHLLTQASCKLVGQWPR